jgi:DNA-binding NarL/FixJ family response regulator
VNATAVAVLADDPITREGAVARLSMYPEVEVLCADRQPQAHVLLVMAAVVDDDLLDRVERAHREAADADTGVVLVAADVRENHVLRAIGAGLVSLLHRHEAGYDRIVRAVVAARRGRAEFPEVTQRFLVDQIRSIQRNVLTPLDLTTTGLAVREVEVLRLLSDGLDTTEVAAKLNYSERTVKNIVHGVVTRFNLRNRTQAVAFALRSGAL